VVVVPITLLHYLLGDLVRTQGETTRNGVVETATRKESLTMETLRTDLQTSAA
jgi:hypothetical protein